MTARRSELSQRLLSQADGSDVITGEAPSLCAIRWIWCVGRIVNLGNTIDRPSREQIRHRDPSRIKAVDGGSANDQYPRILSD